MRKIRRNNDIDISLRLKADGVAVVPSEDWGIRVWLACGLHREEVKNFELTADGVAFRFEAASQVRTGVYSITISATMPDGREFTTDACDAFELVSCSCEANNEAGEVDIETVEATADFAITAFAGVEIVNNITEGGENKALSAEMGKFLNDKIAELVTKSQVYATKDEVASAISKAITTTLNTEV
jgi:hypothetical protein